MIQNHLTTALIDIALTSLDLCHCNNCDADFDECDSSNNWPHEPDSVKCSICGSEDVS